MKRKATILGHVRDVEGGLWDVRDIRDTKYGFDCFLARRNAVSEATGAVFRA